MEEMTVTPDAAGTCWDALREAVSLPCISHHIPVPFDEFGATWWNEANIVGCQQAQLG